MSADRISVAIDPFLRHREKELAYDFVASLADPFSFISLQAVGKKFLCSLPAVIEARFSLCFTTLTSYISSTRYVRPTHQHADKLPATRNYNFERQTKPREGQVIERRTSQQQQHQHDPVRHLPHLRGDTQYRSEEKAD